MLISSFLLSSLVVLFLLVLFFFSSKVEKWDTLTCSMFECGFTSYFYSRFSFSVHYFIVGLIFLFLDLELCVLMPFLNVSSSHKVLSVLCVFFVFALLMGLLVEWKEGKLEWIS